VAIVCKSCGEKFQTYADYLAHWKKKHCTTCEH
jgi:hypothetical protein